MRPLLLGLGLAAAVLATACGGAGGARPGAPEPSAAAAELRGQFFRHDYEGAVVRGRELVARVPTSAEVRAWWVAAMAASWMDDDALAAADSLEGAHPGDRWSELARAVVLSRTANRTAEAVALARRARAAAPTDRVMAWALAEALYRDQDYDEVIALADSVVGRPPVPGELAAELLALRGRAEEAGAWTSKRDTSAYTRALASARAALALDSLSYDAQALLADCLDARGDSVSARAATRRLAALAPLSTDAHRAAWDAVQAQDGLSLEQKRAAIVPDVEALLWARPGYPGVLLAAAQVYRALSLNERRDRAEAQLLAGWPEGWEAERLLLDRIRRLGWPLMGMPLADTLRPELRRALEAFIARPVHHSAAALGEAYTTLFAVLPQATSSAELVRVVEGIRRYDVAHPDFVQTAPFALADRGIALELAEALAREILSRAEAAGAPVPGDTRQDDIRAEMHDALGWIYLRSRRPTLAQAQLDTALALRPKNPSTLLHLGRLQEEQGDLDAAERSYTLGYGVERRLGPKDRTLTASYQVERAWREHPNEAALAALCLRRYGLRDRFRAIVAAVEDSARAMRKRFTLALRVTTPRDALPPFALPALDGRTIALESLRDRIVFVNVWGTWCGPCVAEMPEIQKLHERYRSDPEVAVVTIDVNDKPDAVRAFMQRNGYDFPVLLDDGYAERKAGLTGAPWTFFLDRQGRIGFYGTVVGRTLEEFGWALEALRAEGAAAKAAPRS